jgi:GntR family transcriptional regulator
MKINIDEDSNVPIYIQIEDSISSMISAGQLKPGEQLPTIRELAADIRVNLNTVARAYFELDKEGVISTQRGKGTFVSGVPDEKMLKKKREKLLYSIIDAALMEASSLGYSKEEISRAFQSELKGWFDKNKDSLG